MEELSRVLERFLLVVLGASAVAVFAGAILLMAVMDQSSRSQGGRFYVALGALVALGAIDNQFHRLMRRREASFWYDSPRMVRYRIVSLLALALAAVVLIGLGLLMP